MIVISAAKLLFSLNVFFAVVALSKHVVSAETITEDSSSRRRGSSSAMLPRRGEQNEDGGRVPPLVLPAPSPAVGSAFKGGTKRKRKKKKKKKRKKKIVGDHDLEPKPFDDAVVAATPTRSPPKRGNKKKRRVHRDTDLRGTIPERDDDAAKTVGAGAFVSGAGSPPVAADEDDGRSGAPSELRRRGRTSYASRSATATATAAASKQKPIVSSTSTTTRETSRPPTKTTTSSSTSTAAAAAAAATTKWIRRYLSTRRRDCLLPVPRDFLADGFNLQRLSEIVERSVVPSQKVANGVLFQAALRLLLDDDDTDGLVDGLAPGDARRAAEVLFPLVHARFALSPRGLDAVARVLRTNGAVFGRCPRRFCGGAALLPCGADDHGGASSGGGRNARCTRYCCSCGEVLHMWDSQVDGSAWGSSFCHLLLMVYGKDLFPSLASSSERTTASSPSHYEKDKLALGQRDLRSNQAIAPRIFGFRVHPEAAVVKYPILNKMTQ